MDDNVIYEGTKRTSNLEKRPLDLQKANQELRTRTFVFFSFLDEINILFLEKRIRLKC